MSKRRNWVISGAFLALVGLLLAACGQPGAAGNQLVIISSWTRGDQGECLNAMYEVFKQRHAKVEINNLAEDLGSAVDAAALLATRMQKAEPPDSFQAHADQELIDAWVKTDQLEPVTFLFKDNGWIAKYPPLNGSIPVRADADGGLYDEYQRSAISDLASDQIAPSLANGAAAPAEWLKSVNQIVIRFVEDKDVTTAQQGLAQACKAAEVCK